MVDRIAQDTKECLRKMPDPAIECVAMVEVDDRGESFLWRAFPIQNRFAPSHSHVVMQLALHQQRFLSGIPKVVFRFAASQLFPRIHFTAIVS